MFVLHSIDYDVGVSADAEVRYGRSDAPSFVRLRFLSFPRSALRFAVRHLMPPLIHTAPSKCPHSSSSSSSSIPFFLLLIPGSSAPAASFHSVSTSFILSLPSPSASWIAASCSAGVAVLIGYESTAEGEEGAVFMSKAAGGVSLYEIVSLSIFARTSAKRRGNADFEAFSSRNKRRFYVLVYSEDCDDAVVSAVELAQRRAE